MSLKKLLISKPTFKELLDVAKENNSPVGVVFIAYDEEDWLNFPNIEGKVVYSCIGKDSKGKTKKYRVTLFPISSFFYPMNGEEMIEKLYETQKTNLSLLDKKQINYRVKELNKYDKLFNR